VSIATVHHIMSAATSHPPRRIRPIALGRRLGFTLIEVLLVVIIVAVLAGAIIPRFLGTAHDAKASSLTHNLHVLEAQIELYRSQHGNQYPTIQSNALPQLARATNSSGEMGESGVAYPFGPYVLESPMNPYDGSKHVTAVAVAGQIPASVVGTLGGWQYDETTGAIWPNHAEHYQ